MSINLEIVEKVASALEEINQEVIYVGGAVVSLYVTDEGAEETRPTTDIDISVQITSYSQMDKLRERLASKNIFPAMGETVMYRYSYEGILIDFIPSEEIHMGETNKWLKFGFQKTSKVELTNVTINILPVSIFLATKWEAYKNRGKNEPRFSHDFEDIIYVLDNNSEWIQDVQNAEYQIKEFLQKMSKEILSHTSLPEIIECHLEPIFAKERATTIIESLKKIID